jgi:hypothetical protein
MAEKDRYTFENTEILRILGNSPPQNLGVSLRTSGPLAYLVRRDHAHYAGLDPAERSGRDARSRAVSFEDFEGFE